ncbi:unnamed protein product [Zymoseptoria tritici ST99CH_3D7]|uniref:Uncharacterized protein n=1 Tax=Zymoseptoria tritici (strain ST99CH_3D7) TaxID=1276538 RepID=A0A1X7S3K8_ZYMT9|nr:unnamed protein product [Zymoseptoria tritici ST99CH_3D7]
MATPAAHPPTRCTLLGLPQELRDQVYGHVFADIGVKIERVKVVVPPKLRATNVLLVCHQIYRETVSIYREGYTFRSDETSYASRVLSQLPPKDFLRIRRIHVVYDLQPGPEQGRYPTSARVIQISTAITMLHSRAVRGSTPGVISKAPFIRVVLDSGMLVWESGLEFETSVSECDKQLHAQDRANDAANGSSFLLQLRAGVAANNAS